MPDANELTLVEQPILTHLEEVLGYDVLAPQAAAGLRAGENQVVLRAHLVAALVQLNQIPEATANAIAAELLGKSSNEDWLSLLRGNYSRSVPGKEGHQTIRVVDLDDVSANTFVVTNQLSVKGTSYRIADVVIYINGLPIVVIEAKSAIGKKDVWDAIEDIAVYEHEVPRLFLTNAFNMATNGLVVRYGATGSPKSAWAEWKDPYPMSASAFKGNALELGLTALLEKKRLLDILAHFIVFENDPVTGTAVKKMCRYQQYRAVNKLVARVAEGKHKRGLIWHTQGSGKSLTMAFATLKLKFHRGLVSPHLDNPNILILTDRTNLDTQITQTFQACSLPNPEHAESINDLRKLIHSGSKGRVVLSTIHKFMDSEEPVKKSDDWVLLVDEAHRTQEKDLGAYLRLTFPDASAFGFTGTPVKKNDLNTQANFGAPGEAYLDRYSIEDAVADGATVPIRYLSRMALWTLEDAELNNLFDQTFLNEPKEVQNLLKARGVTRGDLARFELRIAIVAHDIWTHYRLNVQPDGFKAQIVCADRKACTVYKRCLDSVITAWLEKQGVPAGEAASQATAMSACIYSSNGKEDLKPGNADLVKYFLDEAAEKRAIERFKDPASPLAFLIVCDKLLTGFDAPIEQAMYLDSPLVDHGLLQAIARVNRRHGERKDHGIIVDYSGVTRSLRKALSSYKQEDVENALQDFDGLKKDLAVAHKNAFAFLKGAPRTDDVAADVMAAVALIPSEDRWYDFREAATAFLKAHAAVGSDPVRLEYREDAKFIAAVVAYGRMKFEQVVDLDFKSYSEKIRGMLAMHLEVTGLTTLVKLRGLSDAAFWTDFDDERRDGDVETAALRKASEIKRELTDRAAENPAQYATLAARVRALIRQMEQKQISAANALKEQERIVEAALETKIAYKQSGLDEHEFAIFSTIKSGASGAGKAPATLPAERFSKRAIDHLAAVFASWHHARVQDGTEAYKLGSQMEAKVVIELLELVARSPTPQLAIDLSEKQDPWPALHSKIIRATQRLIDAAKTDAEMREQSTSLLIRMVEPFLKKVLCLVAPKEYKKLAKSKKGLAAVIRCLQDLKRIPYLSHLTSEEFEKLQGWELRTSYDNAVRDVVPARISTTHHAQELPLEVWYSAFVLMLGVARHNAADLRAALVDQAEAGEDREENHDVESAPEDAAMQQLARDVAHLYREKDTAPSGWQDKPTVRDDLRQKAKRLLLKSESPDGAKRSKAERDHILDLIQQYAVIHYARP
jgi:type I restriction enzyme R subunit